MATTALITYIDSNKEYKFCYVHSDGGSELQKVLKDKYVNNDNNLDILFKNSHVTYITKDKIQKGKEDLKQQTTKAKARIIINSYDFVEYYYLIQDGKLHTFDNASEVISKL